MKILIFTLLALCLVAVCRSAEEEYDYEDEPSAPVTPAPAKPSPGRLGGLLASRGRAPVGKKPVPTAQSTTAKPVEQPVEDVVEDSEELAEEEEVPTTTTETPKNLVRGGVRPFRSNEDLLAALKRRRAQTPTTHSRDSHTTHAPVEATTKNNKASANRPKNTNEGRSSSRGRFTSSRGGNKQVQEEVEETQQEEVQVKPKPYRRG